MCHCNRRLILSETRYVKEKGTRSFKKTNTLIKNKCLHNFKYPLRTNIKGREDGQRSLDNRIPIRRVLNQANFILLSIYYAYYTGYPKACEGTQTYRRFDILHGWQITFLTRMYMIYCYTFIKWWLLCRDIVVFKVFRSIIYT